MLSVTLREAVTQQTRDVETMLGQCWASVVDAEPALNLRIVFAGRARYVHTTDYAKLDKTTSDHTN